MGTGTGGRCESESSLCWVGLGLLALEGDENQSLVAEGAWEALFALVHPPGSRLLFQHLGAAALTQELLCPRGCLAKSGDIFGNCNGEAALWAAVNRPRCWVTSHGAGRPSASAAGPAPGDNAEAEKLLQENADLPPNTITL